ncbi:acetyl-CoA hydrolase/transferase C-terminal domain-containing protein [Streptomyces sp. NBC_01320]|uniref:acetyl-CoA hydrolase/transferase C-terminal domain-containing protein n=1 Tax=Streptomyces sp. NBC_01320 TaxID=2903824 RepID=UPI002E10B1B2|nr:hypothetical protein OG395_04975 [Streptomyces sp. NBC_01320]
MLSPSYDDAAHELLHGLPDPVVLAAMSPQLPVELVAAVIRESRRSDQRLTLLAADLTGRWPFLDSTARADVARGRLRLVTIAGAVPRDLSALVDFLPNSLWDTERLIRTGQLRIDVFLARMARSAVPDEVGYGEMVGYSDAALATDARAGFELVDSPGAPRGTPGVPVERAQVIVAGAPPVGSGGGVTPVQLDADQRRIAHFVADLVPNGATLQLGLGSVPNAVIEALDSKSDLGIHSGILPGAMQRLLASGRVTGARKGLHAGCHVATGVLGGDPTAWERDVCLLPVQETHDPVSLRQLRGLWAINSAFEIDLAGQVNTEFAGGHRIANGGGQSDFIRAAHANGDGAAVLVLPARSRQGRPRVVSLLPPAHTVTTTGGDLDFVVTEFGVARLRGRTADERAAALVAVAHPEDRSALAAGWREARGL